MFSGWGIRTLATTERRYNPMSYHNGSVWPHDNAIIALGLSRYRNTDAALAITSGIFEASRFMELHRLPELFCGFSRRPGEGPTLYPVACSPQAWSAGAAFMLLEACLGMTIDGEERRVSFRYPRLPPFLRWLEIRGLKVGSGSLDLRLERSKRDVSVTVVEREGDVDVTTHG
jgi:glycogen debranching enzyme